MNAALCGKFRMSLARESSQIKKWINHQPNLSAAILLFRSETVKFVMLLMLELEGSSAVWLDISATWVHCFSPWDVGLPLQVLKHRLHQISLCGTLPSEGSNSETRLWLFFIILSEAGGESLPSFIIRILSPSRWKKKNLISLYHYRHWGVSSFHVLIDLTAFCKKAIIGESLQVTACGESDWQYIYMYILLHRAAADIWRWETRLDDNLMVNMKKNFMWLIIKWK